MIDRRPSSHRMLQAALLLLLVAFGACTGPGASDADLAGFDGGLSDSLPDLLPDGSADLLPDLSQPEDGAPVDEVTGASGSLWVLTYNVAGLPQGISGSNPEANMPQVSPLLNDFDLALVQEDFSYHEELSAEANHPYQSAPWSETYGYETIGDGLNRFSDSPFSEHVRTAWPGCSGYFECSSDCLATKGFSVARHEFGPGVFVDVYNLHMEAGGCPEDELLREAGMTLLLETIAARSTDVAVLVAGDFNLHDDDAVDVEQLDRLVAAGFEAACWTLECGESHIDRIFYRAGGGVALVPVDWQVPSAFVDGDGEPLSDHEPVAAEFAFGPVEVGR